MARSLRISATHAIAQDGCGHSFTVTPYNVTVTAGRRVYSVTCQNPLCRKPFDVVLDQDSDAAVSAARERRPTHEPG